MNLDRTINDVENFLSDVALLPIAGTVAGAAKILLGTVQTVTAVACAILLALPSLCTFNFSSFNYACSHIGHGIGNIIAGTFEAIPLVGTFISLVRTYSNAASVEVKLQTGHENKFMPYQSLVESDWKFGGVDDSKIISVEQKYRAKLDACGGGLSRKQSYELAQQTMRFAY